MSRATNIIMIAMMLNLVLGIGSAAYDEINDTSGITSVTDTLSAITNTTITYSADVRASDENMMVKAGGSIWAPLETVYNAVVVLTFFIKMFLGNMLTVPMALMLQKTVIEQVIGSVIALVMGLVNFIMVKEMWLIYKGARD